MQNRPSETLNDLSIPCLPPPPPPPPPTPPQNNVSSQAVEYSALDAGLSSRTFLRLTHAFRLITHLFKWDSNPKKMLSFYKSINPVIQEGPCCGIVALSMASQLIKEVPPKNILSSALSRHFSNTGELYSAYNVATLASDLFECDARVLSDLRNNKKDIFNHLCDGWPLLIPYDADKNNFPRSNKGQSAHWAVVTGLCFTVPEDVDFASISDFEDNIFDFAELKVHHVNSGLHAKPFLNSATRIFLFAHQGKSKHLHAFDFDELIESNLNMYKVTEKYSRDDFVLPENDALSELRDKTVLLKGKTS